MNNDLISRNDLKKAIKNLYNETLDGIVKFGIEKAYKEIDNAPTVSEDYDTGYQDGLEDGLNDIRQQGEWKLVERKPFIDIVCSNCEKVRFKDYAYNCTIEQVINHLKNVDKDILPPFCENCGADMRKGDKEE